mgnify:CR=1 FL=1
MSTPIASYEFLERNQIVRLRGADNQQNNTGVLYRPVTHQVTTFGSQDTASLTRGAGGGTGEALNVGVGVGGFRLFNSSGGSIICALGVRIPNILWRAGQWDDDGTTPYTDDTVDAQDAGTNDFALNTTTASDGFVIHSSVQFNLVSLDVGTAGDASTNASRYSNTAGSGWTDTGTNLVSDSLESTGERIWFSHTPADWGRTQASGLSGIPGGRYAWNFRSTTAPAVTVGLADSLSIYRMYFIDEVVETNTVFEWWPGGTEASMIPGDALVAFFGTADNLNAVAALVRPRV